MFDDIMDTHRVWRGNVNHESPKALKIRDAVKAIHERGEYPGMQRVMNEIGEPLYREKSMGRGWAVDGEPVTIMVRRWMSGRDNVVRHRAMRELGIHPEPHLWEY